MNWNTAREGQRAVVVHRRAYALRSHINMVRQEAAGRCADAEEFERLMTQNVNAGRRGGESLLSSRDWLRKSLRPSREAERTWISGSGVEQELCVVDESQPSSLELQRTYSGLFFDDACTRPPASTSRSRFEREGRVLRERQWFDRCVIRLRSRPRAIAEPDADAVLRTRRRFQLALAHPGSVGGRPFSNPNCRRAAEAVAG